MNGFDEDIDPIIDDEQKRGLEQKLNVKGIYEAIFVSYDKEWDDLIGKVQAPSNPNKYYEVNIIKSNNLKWGDKSNEIRRRVIEQQSNAEPFNVMVLGKSMSGENRYDVVATTKRVSRPEDEYDLTAEEAFAVLKGDETFYARFMFRGKGWQKDPALRVYRYNNGNPLRKFGFLEPVRRHGRYRMQGETQERRFAESIITREIIEGSEKKEGLKPGDYLIAREIGSDPISDTLFFEPVVNLMEDDKALSPDDKPLVTRVDGYESGDIIHDLPILFVNEDREKSGERFGMGYVKRPEGDDKRFYYKPVLIKGAADLKGKYIPKAKIITNGTRVIFAKAPTTIQLVQ